MKSKDKVAIVTGAGQGIGLDVAKKFLSEGLNVVFVDVNDDLLHQVRNSDFLKDYHPSKSLF